VVPITLNNEVVSGQDSLYASACTDAVTGDLIIKIVNASSKQQANVLNLEGVKKLGKEARVTLLQSNDLDAVNSFDNPGLVSPKESLLPVKSKKIDYNSLPYSFNVIRIKIL
jgi:alpha-L-arabinofuranosidase